VRFYYNTLIVIARRERSERRGNPLDAINVFGECGTITSSQWIATGFALAMTRLWSEAVCGSLSETQWIATGYALAMTRCGKEWQ